MVQLTISPLTLAGAPGLGIQVQVDPEVAIVVERSTDSRTWVTVRGGTGCTNTEGTFFVNDWAAPLNQTLTYRIKVGGSVAAHAQAILEAPGETWIQDAFSPQNGIRIAIDTLPAWGHNSFRQARWSQPVSEALVIGAQYPVESVGQRSRSAEVLLEIHAIANGEADRLRELLLTSGVLLIRGAPTELLPPAAFVAIPDVIETRHGHPDEVATFAGVARICQEPSHLIVIPTWTWNQVRDLAHERIPGATFAEIAAATPHTFQEVANNPALVAGHGLDPEEW